MALESLGKRTDGRMCNRTAWTEVLKPSGQKINPLLHFIFSLHSKIAFNDAYLLSKNVSNWV